MGMIAPRRAAYRAHQFFGAVAAYLAPLTQAERAEARAILPERARPLFDAMPRNDQRHSLQVARTLRSGGYDDPAVLQAALLHDAAKAEGGLTLFHRVAVVLLKALHPRWLAGWRSRPAPSRGDLRYPFWAHENHPARGARLAAEAGCDPLAAALIRRHQDRPVATSDPRFDRNLAALQAADDDN